jgi:hypothetical protein
MAYYPDLSSWSYFGTEEAAQLVAIGWLDAAHSYSRGEANTPFLDKLIDLLVKPWAPMHLLGFAECPFCALDSYGVRYKDKKIVVGALNLFVPGDGFLYAAPSMIAHYILSHNYAPPAEFCAAVLRCPPMRSPEYFEAIVRHGPASFAKEIEASRECMRG